LSRITRVTVQVKVWLPLLDPSEPVTVTEYGLPVWAVLEIVPEITPVAAPIDKPEGNPDALNERLAPSALVATIGNWTEWHCQSS
jgi:hypothetical protein